MISKTPTSSGACRSFEAHPNARTALHSYLLDCQLGPEDAILIPSYVGWSPREGSGVFDPIRQLALPYRFYRVDRSLAIDLDWLRREMERAAAGVLLLIHYFGHVDTSYGEAVSLARLYGIRVVEDEAHAMLSDLIGGICGRLGDVSLFSLHKLLPLASGGTLVRNGTALLADGSAIWQHDLAQIARLRRRNASFLYECLGGLREDVVPLWSALAQGEVPQSFPVRLRHADRDAVYHDLNSAGFGVVTLYHTLIDELESAFPESVQLSRTILNLPIHQNVTIPDLQEMAEYLKGALVRHRL